MAGRDAETVFKALFAHDNGIERLTAVIEVEFVAGSVFLAVFEGRKAGGIELFHGFGDAFALGFGVIQKFHIVAAVFVSF